MLPICIPFHFNRGGNTSCSNARSMCPYIRLKLPKWGTCLTGVQSSSLSCNLPVRASELAMQRAKYDAVHSDTPASLWDLLSRDPHLWPRARKQSWLQGLKLGEERCLVVHSWSSETDGDVGHAQRLKTKLEWWSRYADVCGGILMGWAVSWMPVEWLDWVPLLRA